MSYENPVVGGTVLRTAAIQSPNFQPPPEIEGWSIQQNGNAYFGNITATGTITGSSFDGTDFIINQEGAFFYDGTPATGNLLLSIASAAGTDAYGNTYQAGFATYNGSANSMRLNGTELLLFAAAGFGETTVNTSVTAGDSPIITLVGGALSSSVGGSIYESSTSTTDQLNLVGPHTATDTELSHVDVILQTQSGNAEANGTLDYESAAGNVAALTWGVGGGALLGTVTATHPGTSPGTAETWQTPTLDTGWTVTGANVPVQYKLLPDGNVMIRGEVLTTEAVAAGSTIFTMPAGYIPAVMQEFITVSTIAIVAGTPMVSVLNSSGNVKNGQAFTAAGQTLRFDGVIYSTN